MTTTGCRRGPNPKLPNGLTARQQAFYEALFEFTRAHGYQPTAREMSRSFLDSPHPGGAVVYLAALAKKGWIGTAPGAGKFAARAVRFLRRPDGTPFEGFQ